MGKNNKGVYGFFGNRNISNKRIFITNALVLAFIFISSILSIFGGREFTVWYTVVCAILNICMIYIVYKLYRKWKREG